MNKIHIAKRDTLPLYINIAIRGGAIILALLVCALVTTVLTGENPLSIYGTILKAPSAPPARAGPPGKMWPFCWVSPWR